MCGDVGVGNVAFWSFLDGDFELTNSNEDDGCGGDTLTVDGCWGDLVDVGLSIAAAGGR